MLIERHSLHALMIKKQVLAFVGFNQPLHGQLDGHVRCDEDLQHFDSTEIDD